MKTKVKLKDIDSIDYITYIRPHLESGQAGFVKKELFNEKEFIKMISQPKIFKNFYVSNWNTGLSCKSKSDARRRVGDIIKKGTFIINFISLKIDSNNFIIGIRYEFSKRQVFFYMFRDKVL